MKRRDSRILAPIDGFKSEEKSLSHLLAQNRRTATPRWIDGCMHEATDILKIQVALTKIYSYEGHQLF